VSSLWRIDVERSVAGGVDIDLRDGRSCCEVVAMLDIERSFIWGIEVSVEESDDGSC
jgi:hypothetical protein